MACQKKLDFRLKVIGGEISSVPGISDALEVCQYINICSRQLGVVFPILEMV